MTYNMRLLVGSAVILLMAVVFAQPVLAQGTETYTSIVGMNDITAWIVNPSFEANVANPGQYLFNTVNGWTLNHGSSGSATFRPTTTQLYDANPIAGKDIAAPLHADPNAYTSTALEPNGYYLTSGGGQVLATWKDAFWSQEMHTGSTNWTTSSHQTYVLTFEFGTPIQGDAWGLTVLLSYNGGSGAFMQINNDTHMDNGGTPREGDWHLNNDHLGNMYQFAWSFSTDACTKNYIGKSISFKIGGGTTSGTGYNYFDNFHMYYTGTAGVQTPEPSTVALLVTGVLGMLAYAWRRKRRN